MKKVLLILVVMLLAIPSFGEDSANKKGKKKKEVTYNEKGEIIKTGINFGPCPVVAFDTDRGFQYGALLNLYNFGNGSTYPNPKSTWYFEASAYTKGSMKFIVNYDKRELFPGIRMSICTGYYSDKAMDFYGFNGAQSIYHLALDGDHISDYTFGDTPQSQQLYDKALGGNYPKGFYRYSRQAVKAKVDFTGEIFKNFHWELGYNFNWIHNASFPTENYTVNDGSLFDLYNQWGIISDDEKGGGIVSSLRLGLLYDSRNVENNPTKGIWAEAHLTAAPKWLGTTHEHYKITASFRHYVPIVKDRLTFAYRLAYQGFLGNRAPWYVAPFHSSMGIKADVDGIGGSKTIRGIMLDRLNAPSIGFYNLELRYKFVQFKLWKQNIAFALNVFQDGGYIFRTYNLPSAASFAYDPQMYNLYNKYVDPNAKMRFHGSFGAGLRFIMNDNFIIAVEHARSMNPQDGVSGTYVNTGFLF